MTKTATPETNLMRCWNLIQDTAVQEYDPVSKNSGLLFKNHRTGDFAFICAEDIASIKAAFAVKAEPINGIPATLRHGEGAVARCSHCGRYSLDHRTLGDSHRQPACDCGEKHGWCGSFKKPERDATWSDEAPKPSDLATSPPPAVEPVAVTTSLLDAVRSVFFIADEEDVQRIASLIAKSINAKPYCYQAVTGTEGRGDDCNKFFFMEQLAVDHVRRYGGYYKPLYATPSTDLREENERLENEAVLRKAAYDGVGSLLLEVQQDCIAEHNRATTAEARITELDEEIACLNAELATINFDLEDLKELADLREQSKQMAESGQDDAEARAEAAGTIVTAQAARIAELEAEVMELRRALGLSETISKAVHKQAVEAENLVEKVHAENAEAKREARILAQSMWQQSYSDVTGWQMLDDTAGIITQISNMSAGIRDRAATLSAKNAALKERLALALEDLTAIKKRSAPHMDDTHEDRVRDLRHILAVCEAALAREGK